MTTTLWVTNTQGAAVTLGHRDPQDGTVRIPLKRKGAEASPGRFSASWEMETSESSAVGFPNVKW